MKTIFSRTTFLTLALMLSTLFVTAQKTVYDFTVEEKIGRFVLFDPLLWHSVNKIVNDMERITVAFNMNEISNWAKLENATYIN